MNEQPLPPFLNGVKVSDTFMQYVEPFLNQLILDKAKHGLFDIKIESLDKVLRLPWCIWNAIAAESMSTREIDFLAWIDLILKDMPPSIKNLDI